MGTVLKDYINKPKDIETDRSGNITKAPQDTAAGAMAAQMNFAQTGYGTQLAFLALPKNAKAGAAWSDSSNDGAISRKTNYSIKSMAGNVATVSFEGTMATKSTIEQQGMEVSTNTTGKFSGEETVDIKTGIIQSSNTTSDASGTVSAMGQEFPTSAKVTSTTTVKVL